MLSIEQKINRQNGLGGSDIASLLGFNPYKSKLDLYIEKTTPIDEAIQEEVSEAVRWGNLLEPVILSRYAEEVTDWYVGPNKKTFSHPNYNFLLATPDGFIFRKRGNDINTLASGGIEIKTAGYLKRKEWGPSNTQKIPFPYYLQICHYMLVTDLPVWEIAVLIGGNDFRIYSFDRDPSIEEQIIEESTKFWEEHIEKRIPPSQE